MSSFPRTSVMLTVGEVFWEGMLRLLCTSLQVTKEIMSLNLDSLDSLNIKSFDVRLLTPHIELIGLRVVLHPPPHILAQYII